MRDRLIVVVIVSLTALAPFRSTPRAQGGSQGTAQVQRSVPSTPDRQAIMRHHYLEVGEIHEAVIRGDLEAVRAPARRLAVTAILPAVPATLVPFIATMRNAARRAADAPTVTVAARETTQLIAQCAGCHQAAGIRPAPVARATPDVGGVVGHMLGHQRASDALLLGLLIPSPAEWQRGAELLGGADLRPGDLPPDPKWTPALGRAEANVHALAADARAATTAARRDAVYARLMTTCAECHSLHKTIWGPRTVGR